MPQSAGIRSAGYDDAIIHPINYLRAQYIQHGMSQRAIPIAPTLDVCTLYNGYCTVYLYDYTARVVLLTFTFQAQLLSRDISV